MSKTLEIYGNYPASEVPSENLKVMIREFILDAAIDMGQKPDEIIYDRVFYFITKDFGWLQCLQLASVFRRGSLGQFGAGRLIPKTIYGWLVEIRNELGQKASGVGEKIDMRRKFDDLGRYPMGQAICKKIDWIRSGAITSDEWAKIPLKAVAERIGRGLECTPEIFGIKREI